MAFLLISVVAFFFFEPISDFLLRPLCSLPEENLGPNGCSLIFTSALGRYGPPEGHCDGGDRLRVPDLALSGVGFHRPRPAPEREEVRAPVRFRLGLPVRDRGGVRVRDAAFGLNFLVSLGGGNLIPFFSAADYLGFIGLIILVFGVTFEAPLLLFFLGLVGVVNVEQLRGSRRSAIVVIAIVSAVVTPSQDPYTMLAMAVPLYLFYELAILACRWSPSAERSEPGRRRGAGRRRRRGPSGLGYHPRPMAIKGKKKSQSRGSQGVRRPAAAPRPTVSARRKTSWWRTRDGLIIGGIFLVWPSAWSCGSSSAPRTGPSSSRQRGDRPGGYTDGLQPALDSVTPTANEMNELTALPEGEELDAWRRIPRRG